MNCCIIGRNNPGKKYFKHGNASAGKPRISILNKLTPRNSVVFFK
jgi:hypothetical protein